MLTNITMKRTVFGTAVSSRFFFKFWWILVNIGERFLLKLCAIVQLNFHQSTTPTFTATCEPMDKWWEIWAVVLVKHRVVCWWKICWTRWTLCNIMGN
jgi:hypothetical protein